MDDLQDCSVCVLIIHLLAGTSCTWKRQRSIGRLQQGYAQTAVITTGEGTTYAQSCGVEPVHKHHEHMTARSKGY